MERFPCSRGMYSLSSGEIITIALFPLKGHSILQNIMRVSQICVHIFLYKKNMFSGKKSDFSRNFLYTTIYFITGNANPFI